MPIEACIGDHQYAYCSTISVHSSIAVLRDAATEVSIPILPTGYLRLDVRPQSHAREHHRAETNHKHQ